MRGLGGQVRRQPHLHGTYRLAGPCLHREGTEQLAPLADGDRQRGSLGEPVLGLVQGERLGAARAVRPAGDGPHHLPGTQPHLGASRPGGLAEQLGGLVQHLPVAEELSHPLREVGEDFVRAGPLAVHEPVHCRLHPLSGRLEGHRHQSGSGDRQRQIAFAGAAERSAEADDDGDVHGGDETGQGTVDERLVGDDVDVVEAELEHGDGGGDGQQPGHGQRGVLHPHVADPEAEEGPPHGHGAHHNRRRVAHPLVLLAFVSRRPASPRHEGGDDHQTEAEHGQRAHQLHHGGIGGN